MGEPRQSTRAIIAGGRDYGIKMDCRTYVFGREDQEWMDSLLDILKFEEVVSGGAMGADNCGENWASRHGLKLTVFKADWNIYGSKAGPIRNRKMGEYADILIVFPGGKGTESMIRIAEDLGLKIFKKRVDNYF